MSNYRYQLQLAGALWTIDSPMEVKVDDSCLPFQTSSDQSDVHIRFRLGVPKESDEEMIQSQSPIVHKGHGFFRVERQFAISRVPCACYYLDPTHPHEIQGLLYPGGETRIKTLEKLLDASDMEVQLAFLDAISLHSSLIRYQGKAILFTAPSGTGKSTQALLWEQFYGAEQLNGDRSLLRKIDGVWTAFGSPFAGTSGIYRNESAPVRVIVILRQAEKNAIRKVSQADAFRCLYSESVVPRWNEEIHMHIMDIIHQITEEVPVVLLECRPESQAADLLESYLREESL